MSSSMSPVAPAGEINMQSSTNLSGTHKHTWKEPREGRGEGDSIEGRREVLERKSTRQDGNVASQKSEAGGRRPQTGEGCKEGGALEERKREGEGEECIRLRENKPEVRWGEDLIQDESRNHSDCCKTGTLSFFNFSFTDAEATGWHDDQYNRNCNSGLIAWYLTMGTTQTLQQLLQILWLLTNFDQSWNNGSLWIA